jgi:hypothetical protein
MQKQAIINQKIQINKHVNRCICLFTPLNIYL